eukprot:m.97606 g.97606  ORF g.97606 m.97606 type:complete len:76 (-) comp51367_c0_seq3:122-349(-)
MVGSLAHSSYSSFFSSLLAYSRLSEDADGALAYNISTVDVFQNYMPFPPQTTLQEVYEKTRRVSPLLLHYLTARA